MAKEKEKICKWKKVRGSTIYYKPSCLKATAVHKHDHDVYCSSCGGKIKEAK